LLAKVLFSRYLGGIITLVQIVISDIITVEERWGETPYHLFAPRLTFTLFRAKFQTIIGGIIAFGYAIGPLISGAFLEKAAWRVNKAIF
jgi:MFS family permease